MNSFVILFRQGRPLSEPELAQRQHEVADWARTQNAAGRALEPRILGPAVARPGGDAGSDAWPVSALLFLQAADLADAAAVGASHPAVRHGASIEVRPWAPPQAAR